MWNIASNYLQKFLDIKPPKEFVKNEIIKAIKDVTGVELKEFDIEYKQRIIYIKINNNFFKNEIFINKSKIIKNLTEKLKQKNSIDIRFN